ncbi:MFS transporter [Streptomyces sp. NPDC054783]
MSSRWAHGRGGITPLVSALGCGALSQAARGSVTVLLLIVGFGLCGAMPTIAVTPVAKIVPDRRRGGTLGLMNAVVTTAGPIAPALTGHLVDIQGRTGHQHAVLLAAVLLALGGTASVTLIDPARDARRPVP